MIDRGYRPEYPVTSGPEVSVLLEPYRVVYIDLLRPSHG